MIPSEYLYTKKKYKEVIVKVTGGVWMIRKHARMRKIRKLFNL